MKRSTPADKVAERVAAGELSKAWNCNLHSFGDFSPVDWYAEREGRTVANVEIKVRTHASDTYPTVYLSMRKWLALSLANVGMGVPGIFVAQFTDGLYYIDVGEVDARRHTIAGRRDRGAANDLEPIIEVPIVDLCQISAK